MHHGTTFMHSNFQQNRVSRSFKTVQTNLFAKNANCLNLQLKSRLWDMHYPLMNIQAVLGSIGLFDIRLPRKEIICTNGQTDGRADVAYNNR